MTKKKKRSSEIFGRYMKFFGEKMEKWRSPGSARPPNREGLLAFGNHSFAPSALNPH